MASGHTAALQFVVEGDRETLEFMRTKLHGVLVDEAEEWNAEHGDDDHLEVSWEYLDA